MIPTIIKADILSQPSQARSVTPVAPVTAIPKLQNALPEFTQGQKYQALVEARLPNGSSRVLISDKLFQMRLPEHIQPGNQFKLTLLSQEPKLQFILDKGILLGSSKNNTFISPTGRFLGVLMQEAVKANNVTQTPSNTASYQINNTPILTNSAINSTEIPGLLQKTISQSGLFYESHQAQWINGKFTLEKLKLEPQGKLSNTTTFTVATTKSLADSVMPAHAQSLSLVQQQLTTLETGNIMWRGEIWNGQQLEWDITEESPGNNTTQEASQWKTRLRLSLPQLGDITVTIILNNNGIRIRLNPLTTDTTKLLKNNQQPLAAKMSSAGLNIQSVEVKQDAKG